MLYQLSYASLLASSYHSDARLARCLAPKSIPPSIDPAGGFLRLLFIHGAQMLFELECVLLHPAVTDDVIAIKHGARFVSRDLHGFLLGQRPAHPGISWNESSTHATLYPFL